LGHLLLDRREVPTNLNLGWRERASAIAAVSSAIQVARRKPVGARLADHAQLETRGRCERTGRGLPSSTTTTSNRAAGNSSRLRAETHAASCFGRAWVGTTTETVGGSSNVARSTTASLAPVITAC